MFKKPPSTLKTFSVLRSSEQRRFRDELSKIYADPPPLSEQLKSAKFSTYNNTHGILYTTTEGHPVWARMRIDERDYLVPTVYTLWQAPVMLPRITTWRPVLGKMEGGADLMIPGVIRAELPEVAQGDMVAIAIRGSRFPMGVGIMVASSVDILRGVRGKAVKVIHVYNDHLWAMGDKSKPPAEDPVEESGGGEEYREEEEGDEEADEELADVEDEGDNSSAAIAQMQGDEPTKPSKTTEEIDRLLREAFYQALLFKLTPENATELLPMPASTLYSAYILPSRSDQEVDVKRSSYKKMAKFLKAMDKSGVVKVKEQRGESYLMSVHWKHADLANFTPHTTIEEQATTLSLPQHQHETHTTKDVLQLVDLYKPHGSAVTLIFEDQQKEKDALYTHAEARLVLMGYVQKHGLADPKNPRFVCLDALLREALLKKDELKGEITIDRLPRDQLIQRLVDKMQNWHRLIAPNKEPITRKGSARPVQIAVRLRQGRKTVTEIRGVETFDLSVSELAEDLKKMCASSVTVQPVANVSQKAGGADRGAMEVMVQGPQTKAAVEWLSGRGVPKKYIEISDAKSKKK
ncbi:uncharacterized protein VTP21DRAFT_5546 [Calcarisporiella thermophila]|uniref:uncharacterized protein n=1 Tax=Calcarisporiella thermophila TaxID=911321 RepID=UPI003744AF84